jgi:hypothetical protein
VTPDVGTSAALFVAAAHLERIASVIVYRRRRGSVAAR